MPRNITVYIDDKLDEEMKANPEVNWSHICRGGIRAYLGGRKEKTDAADLLKDLQARLPQLEADVKLLKMAWAKLEPLVEVMNELELNRGKTQ